MLYKPYKLNKKCYLLVYNNNRYSANYRYMVHIYRIRDNGRTCKYYKAFEYDLSEKGLEELFNDFLKEKENKQ